MITSEEKTAAFAQLEHGVYTALETYSNVHRGSGYNSMVTTHLFEKARDIVLEYFGLNKKRYIIIFCTPRRAKIFTDMLNPDSYQIISSGDLGLSIGVKAIAVKKKALPSGVPFQTGGGTTKLISKDWVIWADAPDRFEAGTPAVINIIAFTKALQLIQKFGNNIFLESTAKRLTCTEILYHDELVEYSKQVLLDKFKQTLINSNVNVPTMEGIKPYINLDNSASTPTFAPIWNSFRQALDQNPIVQQEIIHEVKSICAQMLGAPLTTYDVIFTSNTTEAINLAAENLNHGFKNDSETVVLNTLLEHSSNDLPWRMVPNCSLIRVSVDAEGFIDLKEMETLLYRYNQESRYGKKRIRIVAVSGASNVLGVCNDLKEISRITHKYGAQLLVDAAQLIAHRKVNMEECGIDYLAFSAHKVYAPFGCGVLIARKDLVNFNKEEMELIRSSGEENTGGIAALGKALVILQRIGMDMIMNEEQTLTRQTLHKLSQIPGLSIYGIKNPDTPEFAYKLGVIVFVLKGIMANRVSKELSVQGGIGVRHGCLCAHIIIKHLLNISPGLEKFQRLIQNLFPKLKLPGLVRVSLGIENSMEDIDRLIHSLKKITRYPQTPPASDCKESQKLSKADVSKQINNLVKDSALKVFS